MRGTLNTFFSILASGMAALIGALALTFSTLGDAQAQSQPTFVSVAFHEVVDSEADLDDDAITTDRLINFFEFLKADGWTAISLNDIVLARQGKKPLSPKSILITFDDGYADLYTRVFPLLKIYSYPIVSALVGQWMDAPLDANVNYGGQQVPRRKFLTWAQAREMQASGLVEFASHSYDQHFALTADPYGTQIPAMVTYAFEAQANQYETAATFERRIREDMKANTALLKRELGKRPRAFVWPYGRYSLQTIRIAREAGYEFALNLNDEPSQVTLPMEIARYMPERNPTLGELVTDLRHDPAFAPTTRVVDIGLAALLAAKPAEFDDQLGQLIEDVRHLSPTAVILQPYTVAADGSIQSHFAVQAPASQVSDRATRIVWQLANRADVGVYARVSMRELLTGLTTQEKVLQWFAALGQQLPITGIVFADAGSWVSSLPTVGDVTGPWTVRERRRQLSLDQLTPEARLALQAFRQAQTYRPTIELIAIAPVSKAQAASDVPPAVPSAVDLLLLTHAEHWPAGLPSWANANFLKVPEAHRRLGLWLGSVDSLAAAHVVGQTAFSATTRGVSALGWRVQFDARLDDMIRELKPSLSAATFPLRF